MDRTSPEATRDGLNITVEAEAVPAGQSRTDWRRSESGDSDCPHRVRLRELTGAGRSFYVLGAALLAVGMLARFLMMVLAGVLFSPDAIPGLHVSFIAVSLMPIGTMMCLAGEVELIRVWRRPHRPTDFTIVFHWSGVAVLILGFLLMSVRLHPFPVALLMAPSFLVGIFLAVLWRFLYEQSTCAAFSGFPPRTYALLKREPVPLSEA